MNLSPHFTLAEMTASAKAKKHGIINEPSAAVVEALTALCVNVLEPLRAAVGKPLVVSSGYRCARLNALVGGVGNSQHMTGEAVDLQVRGLHAADLYEMVKKSGVPFDQCGLEGTGRRAWVHISYRAAGNRHQLFKIANPR